MTTSMQRLHAVGRRIRKPMAALCCAAIAFGLAACGSGTPANRSQGDSPQIAADNPYAAEFEKNYAETTDPLVKGILKDGQITEAEINEWADGYASCMAEQGVTWSLEEIGESMMSTKGLDSEQVLQIEQSCQQETGYMQIKPLYDAVVSNPSNLNAGEFNTAVLACLKANQLIDQNLTPEEFLTFYNEPDSEQFEKHLAPLSDPSSPNYDRVQGEKFTQCLNNPRGSQS